VQPLPCGALDAGSSKAVRRSKRIGRWAITPARSAVIFGATDAQNTAMLTLEVFFEAQQPPQNTVLQGSHDFNSGKEIGSVSAASSTFTTHIGKQFTRVGNTLTIG